ncbi:MAG: hypothetical protein HY751_06985 [Nitrospinae bacterium]|nr:hypothetical protein [Nitrospinota bacterium]
MNRNRRWAKTGMVIAAVMAFATATLTGCGKTNSETIPSSAPSLTLDVTGASKDSEGRYSIRANARDSIEVTATVSGLSSLVGFYVPSGYGTFTGGTVNTLDGFTYYMADRSGKARATFVAGAQGTTSTGRIDMVARSLDVEATVPLSFDFATLTILPASITITDVSAPGVYVYARGGLPPIEWFVSDPRVLAFNVVNDTTIELYVVDAAAFTGTVYTLDAIDKEGQTAQINVTLGGATACTAATITANPTSVSKGLGASTVVSIVVVDSNQSADTVEVIVSGSTSSTMTLTQWGGPGIYEGSITLVGDGSTLPYTFSYSGGSGSGCQPTVATVSVTPA